MKQKTVLTLEELKSRITNYKSNKPNYSADSIGMCFETPNNLYFFDTGTGKAFRIDAALKAFLYELLFGDKDISFLQQMAEEKKLNLKEILQYIEDEDLLKGIEGNKLYSNEYLEIAEEERKSKCKQLILELTGACNFRCKYCIYSSSEKRFREFNSESMDRDTIRKSIDYLNEYGDKDVFVTFYGGEPLISFDSMQYAIDYARQRITDKELHFGFTTNLTLMTKEIAEYLVRIPKLSIVCSIDGPEEVHDASRVYINGKGTYKDVIRGLYILKEELEKVENPSVTINFNAVYMIPYNKEKLRMIDENFKELCKVTKKSSYSITYPTAGTIPEELEKQLSHTNENTMWEWMQNMAKDCDSLNDIKNRGIVDSLVLIHERSLTEKASCTMPMNACCIPGTRRLYIDTRGDMYVCERINKSPKLGNIHTGLDIENIKAKYYYEYSDKSIKYCSNCWAAKMCPFCFSDRMTEDGISDKAHMHCGQARAHLKQQFSLYHEILEKNPSKLEMLNTVVTK